MYDTKIYLVLCETDILDCSGRATGKKEKVVSHGVGNNTLRNICLPCEHPHSLGAKRDSEGWYIEIMGSQSDRRKDEN